MVRCMILLTLLLLPGYALSAEQQTKPRIVVLATGGTIAGVAASETQTVGYKAAALPVASLLAAVPELSRLADLRSEQVAQLDSKNMHAGIWLQLAERINHLLSGPDVDGIVITHGTDTLEETAYFLNLVVKSVKPVVLVGSMRPSTALGADGPMNIYNAVAVAASPVSRGKGVLVVLNDTINGAREVTKVNTFSLQTFQTPDLGALGYVQSGNVIFYRQPLRLHTVATPFDAAVMKNPPKVLILYGYAGSDGDMVEAAVKAGVVGIVYAGAGNGSIPDSAAKALAEARKKGVLVVRSSRTGSGMVARNGDQNDDLNDFIVADNLTPQKARVLLMLGRGVSSDTKRLQQLFDTF